MSMWMTFQVISVMGCAEQISATIAAMTIIFPVRGRVSLMHKMIQNMFVCISCGRW